MRFTLCAFNTGSAAATRVTAQIELSDALLFVRGATTIDGRPVPQRRKELRFGLGPIGAGTGVTLCADAVLLAPAANGTIVSATVTLDWEPSGAQSERRLECSVVVRSEPAFAPRRNTLTRTGNATVAPGGEIEAIVALENEGSTDANDGVLRLRIVPPLEDLSVFDGGSRLSIERSAVGSHRDTVELGAIEAYGSRRLTLRARVPSPCADSAQIRIGAGLHTRELGEIRLSEASWRVRLASRVRRGILAFGSRGRAGAAAEPARRCRRSPDERGYGYCPRRPPAHLPLLRGAARKRRRRDPGEVVASLRRAGTGRVGAGSSGIAPASRARQGLAGDRRRRHHRRRRPSRAACAFDDRDQRRAELFRRRLSQRSRRRRLAG